MYTMSASPYPCVAKIGARTPVALLQVRTFLIRLERRANKPLRRRYDAVIALLLL